MPTKIEWTDETWNPIRARRVKDGVELIGWHCEHKSPGCVNCYAEAQNLAGRSRYTGTKLPYKPGHRKDVEVFLDKRKLLEPLHWRRPHRIFVCSMTDLFADFVTDEMLDRVFAIMALCPQHTFQLLTKRPDRMRDYLTDPKRAAIIAYEANKTRAAKQSVVISRGLLPLPNVWCGVSVEDQKRADERRADFAAVPAAVKFVSYEPALGPVDWCGWHFVDQIISGGESGPRARPHHPDWHRATRDFCAAHGIAFFFKQWGAWAPPRALTPNLQYSYGSGQPDTAWPDGTVAWGTAEEHGGPGLPLRHFRDKKAAGRLLDGVEHSTMPERLAA